MFFFLSSMMHIDRADGRASIARAGRRRVTAQATELQLTLRPAVASAVTAAVTTRARWAAEVATSSCTLRHQDSELTDSTDDAVDTTATMDRTEKSSPSPRATNVERGLRALLYYLRDA